MAPTSTNLLSFSLSSMEMLAANSQPHQILPSSDSHHPHYHHQPPTSAAAVSQNLYLDNFYGNEWVNSSNGQNVYMEQQIQTQTAPKLENFLGGDTTSSLNTHIYNPHAAASAYLNGVVHDLNTSSPANVGCGFQAYSANSGSDEDGSASGSRASQLVVAPMEQQSDLGFSSQSCTGEGSLSLAVAQSSGAAAEKAIVAVGADSDGGKKVADTFGQRTSIYRGVTRHRWTGRYEAHLWDNSCRREGQARKGRQVYLGGYDKEEKAARAYDLAALKYWGPTATTNFPISNYSTEVEEMKNMTKQEFIASLRRKSSGFSRGASMYRGVTRHHQQGRWQARIGRVAGNKDLYLGTFATEEEAAEAYDIAAIKFRGVNAVTNFAMSRYDVETILRNALPIGQTAKRLKLSPERAPEQKPRVHGGQSQSQEGGSISFVQPQPLSCAPPFDAAASLYQQGYYHHINGGNPPDPMMASGSSGAAPMVAQPLEFYLWPHQSY